MQVVCSSEMVVPIPEDDVRIRWTAVLVCYQNITLKWNIIRHAYFTPVRRFALLLCIECFYNELLINKYRCWFLSVILLHIDLWAAVDKFRDQFTFVSWKVKIRLLLLQSAFGMVRETF